MAGSSQKRERKNQGERVVPNLDVSRAPKSRASAAAGAPAGRRAQAQAEQNPNSMPPRARRQASNNNNKRPAPAQGTRPPTRRGSVAAPPPAPASTTRDQRLVDWLRAYWNNMEPHERQRVESLLLLTMSLFLLSVLTIFRQTIILKDFYGVFIALFGWSSYLLVLGLIAFSIAHLIEGIRNQSLIHWPLVVGLFSLWLVILAESRLILGGETGGIVASLLVLPLHNLPFGVGHILLFGLLIIICILTFRITFGHVLLVSRFIGNLLGERPINESLAVEEDTASSSYLGQRPRYSRYSSVAASTPSRAGEDDDQELEEDEEDIVFEPDFDAESDPQNDINLHKQKIGRIPRGAQRDAQPLNPAEHEAAVRGARQQALPFDGHQLPIHISSGNVVMNLPEMEGLAPNPYKQAQAAAPTQSVKVTRRAAAGNSLPPQSVEAVSSWRLPDLKMLNHPEDTKLHMLGDDTSALAKIIQDTLRSFRVEAEVRPEDISIGPTVIRFGIRPTGKPEMKADEKGRLLPVRDGTGNIVYETRTRVSRIMALQNDLALVLEAKTIRMEAPVPGRPYVGVEIPNKNSRLVTLREILESKEYIASKAKSKLTVALGRDVAGAIRIGDLARMPHLLIAGATGAGKSVMVNTIIASILMQSTPDDVRLLMVDPKMVELIMYNGIPHLLMPVVTEVEKVVGLLRNAINEMERRYRVFSKIGVRNLDGYRKLRKERQAQGDESLQNLPAIVVIIDELADLMMAAPEEVEGMICRIAQLARATGIHLVIATQRPSVDVITGLIKANIPTRISFMVSSAIDSRTIIDMGGAERLLGRGDMLYLPADAGKPERIQGAFLADEEVERLVAYWRQHVIEQAQAKGKPAPVEETHPVEPGWEITEQEAEEFTLDDDLLEDAEQVVREYGRASISLLQRRLRIGYSRAARLIDLLEEHGVIGPSEVGGRPREVFEGQSRPGSHAGGGDGRTMADEVEEIIAEERRRDDSLKKQQERGQSPSRQHTRNEEA